MGTLQSKSNTKSKSNSNPKSKSKSKIVEIEPKKQKQNENENDEEIQKDSFKKNPGKFEDLNQEVVKILNAPVFDGFKCEINQQVSPHLGFSHSVSMGSINELPGYSFGTSYFRDHYALIGHLDNTGTLNAKYIHQIKTAIVTTIQALLSQKKDESGILIDLDYYGSDFTFQLKGRSTKVFNISYNQSLTPRLSGGIDLAYYSQMKITSLLFSTRYATEKSVVSTTFSTFPAKYFNASYVQKISNRIGLGTEIIYNLDNGESVMNFGFYYRLRQVKVNGLITSKGKIASVFEEMLHPLASFRLSAEIDYPRDQYLFGYECFITSRLISGKKSKIKISFKNQEKEEHIFIFFIDQNLKEEYSDGEICQVIIQEIIQNEFHESHFKDNSKHILNLKENFLIFCQAIQTFQNNNIFKFDLEMKKKIEQLKQEKEKLEKKKKKKKKKKEVERTKEIEKEITGLQTIVNENIKFGEVVPTLIKKVSIQFQKDQNVCIPFIFLIPFFYIIKFIQDNILKKEVFQNISKISFQPIEKEIQSFILIQKEPHIEDLRNILVDFLFSEKKFEMKLFFLFDFFCQKSKQIEDFQVFSNIKPEEIYHEIQQFLFNHQNIGEFIETTTLLFQTNYYQNGDQLTHLFQ
ncbi:import receptor subunit tom40 [Anaeramoeba ignava]|uniref:Import receptor subunit tom40 n=1 Tax=Anaeramoeba ignava TaxID=1746090 RepID=A0A9Q0LUB5_ANAIG|nr:import receptor subunit tom40 [Anaeramoeba ignava]